MVRKPKRTRTFREIGHRLWVVLGSAGLTLAFFLILPLMQAISKPPTVDLLVRSVDAVLPPPPDEIIEQEEPEPPPEPKEKEPELKEDTRLLDLQQLELALNAGGGGEGGWGGIDDAVKIDTMVAREAESEAIFTLNDLDQKPRVIYQPGPMMSKAMRQSGGGAVYIIFVVNEEGRVESLKVQRSDNPALEGPALSAVKQWRFEPGKRNGKPVRFRMRVPIKFPGG